MKKTIKSVAALLVTLGIGGSLGVVSVINTNNDTCPIDMYEVTIDEKVECLTKEEYKAMKCDHAEVVLEYGENWFCGNQRDHVENKTKAKDRFKDNKVHKEEFAYLQLLARNDQVFADEIIDILVKKYNKKDKVFDGSKFDSDFQEQLIFFTELADIKCGGNCALVGDNFNEKIFNILTQK